MPEPQLAMTTPSPNFAIQPEQPRQAMTASRPISKLEYYDRQIRARIETGAYDCKVVDMGGGRKSRANFCNIFTDDVSKIHGVNLPRIAEMPSWSSSPDEIKQNANLPAKQKDLNSFFSEGAKDKSSGIKKVSKKIAKQLADAGELVIYSRSLHGSVVAPNVGSKWSVIYRADQADRREKKLKVGYVEPKDLRMDDGEVLQEGLYHIEPDKFNKYREIGIQKHNERFLKKWGEPYPIARE